MAENAQLKRLEDCDGNPTGDYACSLCGAKFRPDAEGRHDVDEEFSNHARLLHGERNRREKTRPTTRMRLR